MRSLLLLVAGAVPCALGARVLCSQEPAELAPVSAVAAESAELGPYRVPEERLVAYTLRASRALTYREGKVVMPLVTDELGLRARRTSVPAEAQRIVVLGDSVAFGFGLDEGGTLAEELEAVLNAGSPARPVACFTVAVPSWNVTDAFRFLLDHLDHFRPDIVLWMPVPNDLEDAYGVDESGERRAVDDPASEWPSLHVRPEWAYLATRAKELGLDRRAPAGPEVLNSGWTPLSRARFARAARTVAQAQARLARTGARLAMAAHEQSDFQRELRASLLAAGVTLDEIALFEALEKADTLVIDPHPSARTVAVMARWLAGELVARGWLGASFPEPEAPAAASAERRARLPAPAEVRAWSSEHAARGPGTLEPRIDPATMQGLLQIYGGINLDGTLEPHFAAALPGGHELVVRLAALEQAPGPLELAVWSDARRLGTMVVPATGPCEAVFALDGAPVLDVHLVADDPVLCTVRGRRGLASARLVALEVRP